MEENIQQSPQMPAMQVPPVQNQPKAWYSNRILQIVVISALIIIGGVLAKQYYKPASQENTQSVAPFGITPVVSGWPIGIPEDFLLSEGEIVVEKYTTETETSRQAVLKYETSKKNMEVFNQFKPWMDKKGYGLQSNTITGINQTFSFTRGSKIWIVTVGPSTKTEGKNLVDFTFEEPIIKQ